MTDKGIGAMREVAQGMFDQALADERHEFGSFFLSRFLGMQIAYENDSCIVSLEVKPPMYNPQGSLHGGVLATASNLVFAGELDGYFDAFDATNGTKLWHFNLGAGVNASPITYRVNGVQYVAVAAGGNSGSASLLAAMRGHTPVGDVVAIFAVAP